VYSEADVAGRSQDLSELFQFVTGARQISRTINAILAEDGLREDLWRVMHALAGCPGLLMGEIAEAVAVSNATVTRLVNELVDAGLVYRKPGIDDGRKAVVFLSRRGQERLRRATSLLVSRMTQIRPCEGFDPSQLAGHPVVSAAHVGDRS
jgi:DNA-binding MarR family transcriptional regulator